MPHGLGARTVETKEIECAPRGTLRWQLPIAVIAVFVAVAPLSGCQSGAERYGEQSISELLRDPTAAKNGVLACPPLRTSAEIRNLMESPDVRRCLPSKSIRVNRADSVIPMGDEPLEVYVQCANDSFLTFDLRPPNEGLRCPGGVRYWLAAAHTASGAISIDIGGGDSRPVGIEECDSYLATIRTRSDGGSSGEEELRRAWQFMAADPRSRERLSLVCRRMAGALSDAGVGSR